MSQAKPVVWFADDPKPNTFFIRSPFRSWKFIVNTLLVAVVCFFYVTVVWKYWDQLHTDAAIIPFFTFLLLFVVYPYWWAIKRHGKIRELYLSGELTEQPADSAMDKLLHVADNSLNEGLRNSSCMFGVFLVALVFWKLQHTGHLFHP
jgi:hypothetical protein